MLEHECGERVDEPRSRLPVAADQAHCEFAVQAGLVDHGDRPRCQLARTVAEHRSSDLVTCVGGVGNARGETRDLGVVDRSRVDLCCEHLDRPDAEVGSRRLVERGARTRPVACRQRRLKRRHGNPEP